MLELDHLAVAAETLEEGRAAIEAALGAPLSPGGRHARFGTHNLLMGLEDGLYLEVIAIDPAAPPPERSRWFGLDGFAGTPRLRSWICRTGDIEGFAARFPQAGSPLALERGDLRWRMAVPADGTLPFDMGFPAAIQWDCDDHPARMLPPSGIRLERLEVSNPAADELRGLLAPVLDDGRVVFRQGSAGLRAEFATPAGPRTLE